MNMEQEQERRQFRKKLKDLTQQELLQQSFLTGLAVRIETEILAFHALWAPDIALEPPPDTQLTTLQYLLSGEVKRRSSTKAKVQKLLPTTEEGETNHADHAENGNH